MRTANRWLLSASELALIDSRDSPGSWWYIEDLNFEFAGDEIYHRFRKIIITHFVAG